MDVYENGNKVCIKAFGLNFIDATDFKNSNMCLSHIYNSNLQVEFI